MIIKKSPLEKFIKLYGTRPTEIDPRYLELLDMGRYRVLEVPDVQPGSCCNCGASRNDGRMYIDTGRHVEWYGAIFFCGHCLREYAEAMGLLDKVKKELEEIKSRLESQDELNKIGDRLHSTITQTYEEFKEYYARLYSSSDGSSSDSGSDVESNKTAKTESTVNATKQGTVKSTTGTGRPDLRSLTELLKS